MVLDNLGSSLKATLKKVASAIVVNDTLLDDLVRDLQRALLAADCDVTLVLALSEKIKKRFKAEKTPGTISTKEHLINIVYEELTQLLGGEKETIQLSKKKPFIIMLVGLFGSGKTTTISKLGHYYKTRGHKVAAVGLDTFRPKAREQLVQNAKGADITSFVDLNESDPAKAFNSFKDELNKFDIVLVDTAGRDALNSELIKELKSINSAVKPDETLLILSADIGKTAEQQAKTFAENTNITGIMITKLDGTSKAGGALSACRATGAKIKFVGVGEKKEDLESFNPKGFVGRMLGMGDLDALLEKANVAIDEDQAQGLQKRMLSGKFNLLDLYEQMSAMKKMGSLSKLMEMVPGMGQLKISKNQMNVQEEKLKKWKFMLDSMTKQELEDPAVISTSRIERITNGSGTDQTTLRELLKQFRQSKKMLKMLKGGDPQKMMKKFQKSLPQGM